MAVSLVTKMLGSGLQVDSAPSKNSTNVYVPPVTQGEGIYSRDALPRKIRKECGIINLDDIAGAGIPGFVTET